MLRASVLVCSLFCALPTWAGAKLVGIDVRPSPERIDVVLRADAPPTFQSWARSTPPVLVVDLLDTDVDDRTAYARPGGVLEQIDVTREDAGGLWRSRLQFRLKHDVDYDVTARGNDITVSIFLSPAAREAARGQARTADFATTKPATLALGALPKTRSDVPGARIVEGSAGRATAGVVLAQTEGGPRQMTYIGFKNSATQSRLYARMNAEAKFTLRKEGENLVILEIQNATIPLRNNKNHLDTTFFESPVKMITPSEVEDASPTVRIAIEMKEAAPYEAKLEGRDIVVTFKK